MLYIYRRFNFLGCIQRRLALANLSCHLRDDPAFALDSLGPFSLLSKPPLKAMVVNVGRTYESFKLLAFSL